MSAEKEMKFLGEFFSVKWYLADEGFKVPGIYYWNGKTNVLVKPQDEMTTPTPNEREVSDAHAIMRVPRSENEVASFLASYRQQIEAEKDKRISTLEGALGKAEKLMHEIYCASGEFREIYIGKFTHPLSETLVAIAEVLHPTSPPSTSTSSTDSAAAK